MSQYSQLTEGQRYQISALLKAGTSQQAIAEILEVSPSTISRELECNTGKRGYRPKQAHINVSSAFVFNMLDVPESLRHLPGTQGPDPRNEFLAFYLDRYNRLTRRLN